MSLKEFLKKHKIQFIENFDTSLISWFKIGINVSFFLKINTMDQLQSVLDFVDKDEYEIITCGLLSNIVFCDKTKKKIILIKLLSDFSNISIDNSNNEITAGAGVFDKKFSIYCMNQSIENFEFLSGIPGSIGGNIIINAGCYGSEIFDNLIEFSTLDLFGNNKIFKKSDIDFSYRKTNIKNQIITSAKFNFTKGEKSDIQEKMNYIFTNKNHSQINGRTFGSTFKNPNLKIEINGKVIEQVKAWQLIDACNLRGFALGNISVSEKHCNFLVSRDNFDSQEVNVSNFLSIISIIKEKVLEKFNIELKEEVFIK